MAEVVADSFVKTLDMRNLSKLQCHLLHEIKRVAIREWAKEQLKQCQGAI